MQNVFVIVLAVTVLGIMVLLCLFSCVVASMADEHWERVRKKMEKKDDERR